MHLRVIVNEMEAQKATEKTDMGSVLHDVAERIKHKGLVILISDLFDKPESILSGLQHFKHNRHDVIVIHVLDEAEVRFPFDRMTRFDGLEGYPYLVVDRARFAKPTWRRFRSSRRRSGAAAWRQQIDYVQVTTDQPVEVALTGYLAKRLSRTRAK